MSATTLFKIGEEAGECFKLDHQADLAFIHANFGGFSFCQVIKPEQCEQLSRAFARAAFLIEQHEDAKKPPPAPPPAVSRPVAVAEAA